MELLRAVSLQVRVESFPEGLPDPGELGQIQTALRIRGDSYGILPAQVQIFRTIAELHINPARPIFAGIFYYIHIRIFIRFGYSVLIHILTNEIIPQQVLVAAELLIKFVVRPLVPEAKLGFDFGMVKQYDPIRQLNGGVIGLHNIVRVPLNICPLLERFPALIRRRFRPSGLLIVTR